MSSPAPADVAIRLWSLEDFTPLVGEQFVLADVPTALMLTGAAATGNAHPGAAREPFELFFRSASADVLPQQNYRFHHASLGTTDIFIVPIANEGGAIVYQAIFS